ncbi:MAG: prepilin-type N-terminal cleavage/methylation domain-containing protein [Candidatus Riflebacteria bacterium]|nr:prepilin-type N-terminal cleavage/methylation domain-containing protein [Candidatus Riflebacteria bacterium]
MKISSSKTRGFSFAELVVAVLILGIGILPIFWFFSRTSIGTIKTRDEALAWQYAAELIDYSMARGYEATALTDDNGIEVREIIVGSDRTTIDDRFGRRLYVKALRPDHNSEWPCLYRTVTAEVTWTVDTQPRSLRLTGLLYAQKN